MHGGLFRPNLVISPTNRAGYVFHKQCTFVLLSWNQSGGNLAITRSAMIIDLVKILFLYGNDTSITTVNEAVLLVPILYRFINSMKKKDKEIPRRIRQSHYPRGVIIERSWDKGF